MVTRLAFHGFAVPSFGSELRLERGTADKAKTESYYY